MSHRFTLGLVLAILAGCSSAVTRPAPPPIAARTPEQPMERAEIATSTLASARKHAVAPDRVAQDRLAPELAAFELAPHRLPPELAALENTARALIESTRASRGGYDRLVELTDGIGNRLSGSPQLDAAIAWAAETMRRAGLDDVHTEPVLVPHWVRGIERAEILIPGHAGRLGRAPRADRRSAKDAPALPTRRPIALLALGGSGATPPGGLRAPVLIVSSLEDLEAKKDQVKGKIVLFNKAMPPFHDGDAGYGKVVGIRGNGPAQAAKLGAKAALVRSLTARSLRSPHTGATRPEPGARPFPAAAIAVEDAELIARFAAQGPVEVELELGAKLLPDAPSANVVAEIRGRERPDEIVLLGAHLDSWDVGQGAHDDGGGCAAVIEALSAMRRLHLEPRRTVRAVLFTNEENGLRGAAGYAKAHAGELAKHIAAIEMDTGTFSPLGFSFDADKPAPAVIEHVSALARLLAPLGANRVVPGYSGADVHALEEAGTLLLGLEVEGSRYFDYHHSQADTLDKISADDLAADAAALAIMAYALAERGLGQDTPVAGSP